MKKITGISLCIMLLIASVTVVPVMSDEIYTLSEDPEAPALSADAAVLINGSSGEILYDKNCLKEEFPASTTKIMTALVVLENLKLDQQVIVSADAAAVTGATANLVEGEVFTVEQLLYGMMLNSANDAAVALAEATSSDLDSFAAKMNEKAIELGGTSTYFITPNGLPNEAHVTSAYDLALYTKEAMKNETFRKLVSTVTYDMPATNKSPKRTFHNTNKLLFDKKSEVTVNGKTRPVIYDGVIGVKTGFTNAAQGCLVAAFQKEDTYLIAVVMHCPDDNRYQDMIALLDYGVQCYESETVLKAGDKAGKALVKHGKKGSVSVTVKEDIVVSVRRDGGTAKKNTDEYSYEINTQNVEAPQKAGAICGKLKLLRFDKEIAEYDLITSEDVEQSFIHSLFDSNNGKKHYFIIFTMIIIVLPIAAYLSFVVYIRRK